MGQGFQVFPCKVSVVKFLFCYIMIVVLSLQVDLAGYYVTLRGVFGAREQSNANVQSTF